jgi:hypothetical protein
MANLLNQVKTYKLSYPRSQKDTYQPLSSVDWLIRLDPGFEIVKNSIFVSGNLYITVDGLPYDANPDALPATNEVYYDNFSGWHALFDVWSSDLNQQNVENFDNYPRFMRMMTMTTKNSSSLSSNLSETVEGRVGHHSLTPYILSGEEITGEGGDAVNVNGMPINIKPYIAVNRTNRNINYSDVPIGILLHTRLSPVENLLFGPDALPATSGISYYLKNLQLNWQVQPVQQTTQPLTMGKISWKDYTLSSKTSSIEVEVPIPTQNICMTLALEDNLITGANPENETNGLYNLPHPTATNFLDCSNVQFFLNDTNNNLLSFELEDLEEQIMNYKYSMGVSEVSYFDDITIKNAGNWSSFGLGLNMSGLLPVGTKISMVLNSQDANGPDTNKIWRANCYFKGMITL